MGSIVNINKNLKIIAYNDKSCVWFKFYKKESRIIRCETNCTIVNNYLKAIRLSRSYNTWINYAYDLKTFFSIINKKTVDLKRADCICFIDIQYKKGLSISTVNRRLATVAGLLEECIISGTTNIKYNFVNPESKLSIHARNSITLYKRERNRIPKILDTDVIEKLLDNLNTWRDRSIIYLLWISCLRISEALSIKLEDIECSNLSIVIRDSKNREDRTVFIDKNAFTCINNYLDFERCGIGLNESFLFVSLKGKSKGKHLTANSIQKMLRYYSEKLNLPHIHPHLFRHTGITQLVQNNMNISALRKFIGHKNPKSIEPYLHLSDEFISKEFSEAQSAFNFNFFNDGDDNDPR